jgi:lipopolysaccharide transport system ATP-binding protein
MGEVAAGGRTVLFVSHNMAAVQGLCTAAMWLHEGKIMASGCPGDVISTYLQSSFSALTERVWEDLLTAPGNEKIRLRRACVRPLQGSPADPIDIRTPFVMEFEYWNLSPGVYLNLSLSLINEQGITVFATTTASDPVWHGHPFPVGLFRSTVFVPGDLLNDGNYRVLLRFVHNEKFVIYQHDDLLFFEIRDSSERRSAWYGRWPGVVRPELKWTTELVQDSSRQ